MYIIESHLIVSSVNYCSIYFCYNNNNRVGI